MLTRTLFVNQDILLTRVVLLTLEHFIKSFLIRKHLFIRILLLTRTLLLVRTLNYLGIA